MPYGEDTEAVQILGNIKHAPDHRIGSSPIVEPPSTHLNPTGAQPQFLCLILHGDGSNGTILNPTVVLHRVAQYDDSHRSPLEELSAEILGIREFFEIQFVIDNHELPGPLPLRGGRHQTGTENQFQIIAIDLLFRKFPMAATQLRQVFEICHTRCL